MNINEATAAVATVITHLQDDVQELRAQVLSINDHLVARGEYPSPNPSPTVPQPSDPADQHALFASSEREVIHAIATRATRLALTEDQHARDAVRAIAGSDVTADAVMEALDHNTACRESVFEIIGSWADDDGLTNRVGDFFDSRRGQRVINDAAEQAMRDSDYCDADNVRDLFAEENLIDRDDLDTKIEELRDEVKETTDTLHDKIAGLRDDLTADIARERSITFAAIDSELLGPKGDKFAAHVAAAVVNMFSGMTLEQRLAFIVTGTLPVTPAPVADHDAADAAERRLADLAIAADADGLD